MKKFFLLAVLTVVTAGGCSSFATKEEVAALRGDVSRFTAETRGIVDRSRRESRDNVRAIGQHEDRLRNIEGSIASQQSIVSDLSRTVAEVERGIASTNDQVTAMDKIVGRLGRMVHETNATVDEVKRSVGSVSDRLASLEKRVTGVRRITEGRIGTLEDNIGVDHKIRLLQLSGFATKSCELTPAMKKRLDEIVELVKKGDEKGEWRISPKDGAVGFADTVPYKNKDGKDLNPELARNRAKAVAEYLGKALDKTVYFDGRGTTTKFGDQDMNRSALVHLERVAPAAPAPTATPPAAPTAPDSTFDSVLKKLGLK